RPPHSRPLPAASRLDAPSPRRADHGVAPQGIPTRARPRDRRTGARRLRPRRGDGCVGAPPAYDLGDVHERAERLARRHAAALGPRSLDTLHVAAAQALGISELVTGDRGQSSLAKAAGLTSILVASRG